MATEPCTVRFVHLHEVPEICHEDGDLNDVLRSTAAALQDGLEVIDYTIRLGEHQQDAIAELVTVSNNLAEARLATSDARFLIVNLSGKPTDDLNLQAELPRRAERILSALSSARPRYALLFVSFDPAWAAFRKAFGPKS